MTARGAAAGGWIALLAGLLAGLAVARAAAVSPPTRVRAGAFARAVNLGAADVPGFTRSVSATTPADQRFGAQVARCAGGANPGRAVGNTDSPEFTRVSKGGTAEQDVTSNVTVLPTVRRAAQDLAAIRSTRGKGCLVAALDRALGAMKTPVVSFGRVSVSSSRPPAPGAAGSFALRFSVPASVHGLRIPFTFAVLGFTRGPAEVALTTLATARPFPAANERRLFLLLLGRATASRL